MGLQEVFKACENVQGFDRERQVVKISVSSQRKNQSLLLQHVPHCSFYLRTCKSGGSLVCRHLGSVEMPAGPAQGQGEVCSATKGSAEPGMGALQLQGRALTFAFISSTQGSNLQVKNLNVHHKAAPAQYWF